jgi:hypothetical protein
MASNPKRPIVVSAALLAALACSHSTAATAPPWDTTLDASIAAATATANTNPNCSPSVLGPYYWEVGDKTGVKASGSVGGGPNGAVTATTQLSIASASKWLYAAYVVQVAGGPNKLDPASDIPFLNFTSGYAEFGSAQCETDDTVGSCLNRNGGQNPAAIGMFDYDSGHMEHHAAAVMSMLTDANPDLKDAVLETTLAGAASGTPLYTYTQPLLAGGVMLDASTYGAFLRGVLAGSLLMKDALGTHAVCTNPSTCATSLYSPITSESWSYSLGHWVEDDPQYGDHAFSSAGAFGFYPWIDSTKTIYGILAREVQSSVFEGFQSAECGRLIRQAWVTGETVTSTEPTPHKP